jgi:hypothetical protein
VVLAHRDFLESLLPLKALRESEGLAVALVDVEDVYDEFGFGAKSPEALKAFLLHTQRSWGRPPRFLLLFGDASFDPRNHLGLGDLDLVPTKLLETRFLETASDDWFADFDGDDLPDLAVGRIPAGTTAEAEAVVAKLLAYAAAESGSWAREALLVSDDNDLFDFQAASRRLEEVLPPGMIVREVSLQRSDTAAARQELLAGLEAGQLLVNYIGHGSVEVWAREGLLSSRDALRLTNSPRLPLVLALNCLNGFFHDLYTESLAESLLKAPRGGAVAVWASSGLPLPDEQPSLNQELARILFDGTSPTLGEAVVRAKAAVRDRDLRRSWILFGDPATRLRR